MKLFPFFKWKLQTQKPVLNPNTERQSKKNKNLTNRIQATAGELRKFTQERIVHHSHIFQVGDK